MVKSDKLFREEDIRKAQERLNDYFEKEDYSDRQRVIILGNYLCNALLVLKNPRKNAKAITSFINNQVDLHADE